MMKMMRLVELLLPVDNSGSGVRQKVATVSKIGLRVMCWAVALLWVVLWLLYPTTPGSRFKQDVSIHVVSSFFGTSATFYVLYACPVIALAIFALLHLELTKRFPAKTYSRYLKHALEILLSVGLIGADLLDLDFCVNLIVCTELEFTWVKEIIFKKDFR